jgi:hypothetical protein
MTPGFSTLPDSDGHPSKSTENMALTATALARLSIAAFREALNFAARAAAITCSRRGADLPGRAALQCAVCNRCAYLAAG